MGRRWRGWLVGLLVLVLLGTVLPVAPVQAITDPELTRALSATVRLWPLDAQGKAFRDCSGTVVDPSGIILTAWRCVGVATDGSGDPSGQGLAAGQLFNPQGLVQVGPTVDPRQPARPTYLAEYTGGSAQDEVAVLRIVRMVDPQQPMPPTLGLVALPLGDSQAVQLGDAIHVLGYAAGQNAPVTAVDGTVTGFAPVGAGKETGALKFDAAVTPGHMGGPTLDDLGQLIGVTTGAGGAGPVDRAVLAQLALAYLNLPAEDTVQETTVAAPSGFGPIRFGTNVTGGRLVGEATSFPVGTSEVFALISYKGMSNGTKWGRVWKLNGQIVVDKRDTETWDGGAEGSDYWSIGNEGGLSTGKWELLFFINGKQVQSGTFSVGTGTGTGTSTGTGTGTNTSASPFGQLRFGTNVKDGVLVGEATTFPVGTKYVYALWDYTGMKDGAKWGRVWYWNGQIDLDKRSASVWNGGPDGSWYASYGNDESGLDVGDYELELYVNNQPVQRAKFTIGRAPAPPATGPFGAIHFGTDITSDNKLVGEATTFPSGTEIVAAQWSYTGMRNGARWGRIWYLNGNIWLDKRNASVWDAGPSGNLAWTVGDKGTPLDDGAWELVLYVDGQIVQRGSFTVGGRTPTPTPGPRPKGVAVKGKVVDNGTGAPVGGATVLLLKPGTTLQQYDATQSKDLLIVAQAKADASGNFTTPPVPPGATYPVAISAPGYGTTFFSRSAVKVPADATGTFDAGTYKITKD